MSFYLSVYLYIYLWMGWGVGGSSSRSILYICGASTYSEFPRFTYYIYISLTLHTCTYVCKYTYYMYTLNIRGRRNCEPINVYV